MIEKYEARHIKQEISRVLWEVWDPIGVNSEPMARGEYDGYVNAVFIMLTHGSTDFQLASHLLTIAKERMGLASARFDDMLPTVNALRKIPIASN